MRKKATRSRGIALAGAVLLLLSLDCSVAVAKTTITYWTFLNPESNDPRSQAVKGTIKGFEAANPDISVKVETIHYGKIDSLTIQAAAAGRGPDVVQLFSGLLAQHVKAKSIVPLDPFMQEWKAKNQADYLVNLKDLEYDGQVMALPWELRVLSTLVYRKDLLEAAGASVPRTLDELSATAKKLATDRVVGFAAGLSEAMLAVGYVDMFYALVEAYGGRMYDDQGRAAFNSPSGQKAMEWIVNLYRTGAASKSAVSMTYDDITSGLKAGTIAMAFHGTHRIGTVRASQFGPQLEFTLMPGVTADQPAPVTVAGQALSIGANSKDKQAAWKFIEHTMSAEAQLLTARALMAPVRKSTYSDPFFSTPDGKGLLMWRDAIATHGRLQRHPEDWARLGQILARSAQTMVLGNVPVKQGLDQAAEQYNAGLPK